MPDANACWKCGSHLTDIFLPLPRLAECPSCRAQLHVCRMCVYFDPAVSQQCREPIADHVADKTRANYCGYFQINPNAFTPASGQAEASRSELESLFGDDDSADQAPRNPLDDLFRK